MILTLAYKAKTEEFSLFVEHESVPTMEGSIHPFWQMVYEQEAFEYLEYLSRQFWGYDVMVESNVITGMLAPPPYFRVFLDGERMEQDRAFKLGLAYWLG